MTGFISGSVKDSENDPLVDATVVVSSNGNKVASTKTDSTGFYTIQVTTGTYDVRAEMPGYRTQRTTDVTVNNNETTSADFLLIEQPFKIIGELSGEDSLGILGYNDVGSGTPIGVKGAVPGANGYGLLTPDDALIGGSVHTDETDFVVEAGTTNTVDATNVVLGHANNTATSGVVGAAIGGGGIYGNGLVGANKVQADYTTIGGGIENHATGFGATVSGGEINRALSPHATVSGGQQNDAVGEKSTVPGGAHNEADGRYSFAAGRRAKASEDGAFVWADDNDADFRSNQAGTSGSPTGARTFHVRSTGGVRLVTGLNSSDDPNAGAYLDSGGSSWKAVSAKSVKHDVRPVDPDEVLSGVESLTVSRWAYDANPGVDRMGPMAGEFSDTFELGDDPETIGHVDADGVALAAIQGLSERLERKDDRIDGLETEVRELRAELTRKDDRIEELETNSEGLQDTVTDQAERIETLEAENERLRDRLTAIENQLDRDGSAATLTDD